MTARLLALALVIGGGGGCATIGQPLPEHRATEVWRAIELDERSESRLTLASWLEILRGARFEEDVASLALERVDALVNAGIADGVMGLHARDLPSAVRPMLERIQAKVEHVRGGDARGHLHDAGCEVPWRAGSPLGRLAHLDVARPLDDAVFASPSTIRMRDCRVVAITPDGRPGAIPIGVEVDAPVVTTLRLAVTTSEPYRVWVDGVATPMPDEHAPLVKRRTFEVAPLPMGKHRIAIVVAAPLGRVELGLELDVYGKLRAPTGAHFSRKKARIEPSAARPRPAHELLSLYLDAARALVDGDGIRARGDAALLVQLGGRSAAALSLAARVASEDSTVPSRIARDRGRRLYERALALAPKDARAREALGRLALDRERTRDALELAQGGALDESRGAVLYADALRARGRDPEVREVLGHAHDEGQCALADALLTDDRLRHRPVDLARAARLAHCRPGSLAYAEALRQTGDLDRAVTEYRRLATLDPIGESARSSLAELLVEKGRLADAIVVLRDLVDTSRRSATYRLRLIDALLASGDRTSADRFLRDGVALDPESAELTQAARARSEDRSRLYAEDRIDGRTVIATFESAHPTYEGPAVFVLDRNVARVYPTGGQRAITHDIVKVLTKDGIDRWGEWTIPAGAELLTLCAWKPDGARLEPEQIAEKESVSLPGLAVGDYVEVEYVERSGPAAAFAGGFLSERFFFGSFDAPLDRSEYVVVTPHGMHVDVDRRAEPPSEMFAVREEPTGSVDVRTFAGRAFAQRRAEPSSAPGAEYLPSVRLSSGVSKDAWRAYLVDLAWGTRRRDPELDAVAHAQTAGARTDREKLARLDRWVRRTIKQGGGIDDTAATIFARREGHRATLLCALAEAVRLPARLLLARSRKAAQIDVELEGYDQLLVEADGLVDDVRTRHGRPGELQPHLRGADALPLDLVGSVVRLPDTSPDSRALAVKIALAADGGGEVRVEERLTGWPAVEWRDALETLPPDRVRTQFEQRSVAGFFPGGTLRELSWDAAEDDDRPFVVRYSLNAPGLARRAGGALALKVPFAGELMSRYATGDARTSPMLLDEVAPTTLDLSVMLFPGAVAEPYPPTKLDLPNARFAEDAEARAGVLHLRSRFFLPLQRLAAEHVPEFLTWAAEVDRAEAAAAHITKSK